MSFLNGVRPDHEIGENAAGAGIAVSPAAGSVGLECSAGRAPNSLVELPIGHNPRVLEEGVQERFVPVLTGQQFRKYGGGDDQATPLERRVQGCLGG